MQTGMGDQRAAPMAGQRRFGAGPGARPWPVRRVDRHSQVNVSLVEGLLAKHGLKPAGLVGLDRASGELTEQTKALASANPEVLLALRLFPRQQPDGEGPRAARRGPGVRPVGAFVHQPRALHRGAHADRRPRARRSESHNFINFSADNHNGSRFVDLAIINKDGQFHN